MNVDSYLTLHQIQSALSRVAYRPGWRDDPISPLRDDHSDGGSVT